MPRAPSKLRFLPSARDDLTDIQTHNPDHAGRIFRKIADWKEKIGWGRVPQQRLTYLSGSGGYNFYRERVGNSGYRVIYEISGDSMTVVAVLPKGDHTYDLDEFRRRMDRA
ncbi:hypothetical protein C440_05702 [Haloferax mucosum ATCC BAA-1512]|uniref:Cytotoxic translational repressor of toxin-antitoxin stability system n=1 Tax=Haloferax mucosum ATCC BAA-1512 TaxID=662479 RepID=M0IH17_9EURY|nr:type II toxin-antitoxin system RelE/ParE family toxin [Haloferax mucosum]ELZ96060.1 hypothetical protein C440_05702 [Haloferax mucosum ATCC BAA-1512]